MIESLITISITGLIAGFILSMPIAGPVSILITSNALRGHLRYCNRVNIGASLATIFYVFVSVYGLSLLFPYYLPALPYLLSAGSLFLIFTGYRVARIKVDLENFDDTDLTSRKTEGKRKGGFYTGFMVNFLNPTLLIGWFTSTFLVISFVSSLGFNTGGLDISITRNAGKIINLDNGIEENHLGDSLLMQRLSPVSPNRGPSDKAYIEAPVYPGWFHFATGSCFALFIAAGCVIWFSLLSSVINRFRRRLNSRTVNILTYTMGIAISIFGLYFGFLAIRMFHLL